MKFTSRYAVALDDRCDGTIVELEEDYIPFYTTDEEGDESGFADLLINVKK